ncbi:MAG: hypothetical protein LBV18_01075 [Alistipes sp.]|nr:hypothetical protein [Alistipes sp.]
MNYNSFDNEYYVMSMDGANNHPLLAWGSINFSPFLKAQPVDESGFTLPLQIIFDEPYPKQYEMADLLMLASLSAVSGKFKELFENMNIHGVQFVPIEVTSNKKEVIKGHWVLHIWNKLEAIDKDNYEGSEPNRFGTILSLVRFSLDAKLLESIELNERLIFELSENKMICLVHQSVYDAIQAAELTGMRFWKVSEWDEDALFR